jgi:hypothetical protein
MIRSTSLAIFLIAMSPGPAAYGQETGGNRSVVTSPSGAALGQPLNSDHLAPTGKTLPNPGVPKPPERQSSTAPSKNGTTR